METLLLPGMDGTGKLLDSFAGCLPASLHPRIVRYPTAQPLGYAELLEQIAVPDGSFAIVAESFSGPLAIQLAARYTSKVRALVLVATFVRNPSWLGRLASVFVGRARLPDFALRRFLLGSDAGVATCQQVRDVLGTVEPSVLAGRLREIVSVDVEALLSRLRVPLLYVAPRRDRLIGASPARRIHKIRPDLTMCTIDGPHLLLFCRPLETAAVVVPFLERFCAEPA